MANERQNKTPGQDPEQQRLKKEEQSRTARRRNRQLIGLALTVLIVVGAYSIVTGGINLVRGMLNSDEERLEYQRLFEPMVWFDILPFESVSQVDENSIKEVAIWGVMNEAQQEDVDDLPRNEYDEQLVSASLVDQYAARMFGPNFRFSVHESFSNVVEGLHYTYNPETQMYAVPVTGQMQRYLASVVEIQREAGGIKRVVMGYISTQTADNQIINQPDYDHPAKYMDYELRRDGSDYYLVAMRRSTSHQPAQTTPAPASSVPAAASDSSLPAIPPVASGADSSAAGDGDNATDADGADSSAAGGEDDDDA